MMKASIDLERITGRIRPMHAVNNGPFRTTRASNVDSFRAAGFPCVRMHDAAYTEQYGAEHVNDVLNIFRDFDADPLDPENYDFTETDRYIELCEEAGCSVLFRLGSKIEHTVKKYQTYPPKDFGKWNLICAQIIRHLCCGWADGHFFNVPYIEIWNEPDLKKNDRGLSPCWQGTDEEFCVFFEKAAKYLKAQFPDRKIGGPAFAGGLSNPDYMRRFLSYMAEHRVPLDFLSHHRYTTDPQNILAEIQFFRSLLDEYGYRDTELIFDEWNYVKGWTGEDMIYSFDTMRDEKGAAFCAAVLLGTQKSAADMAMYYDARPEIGFDGIFEAYTYRPEKPYYAFSAFNRLYRLGTEVHSESSDDRLYVVAARSGGEWRALLTVFDDTKVPDEDIELSIEGLPADAEISFENAILQKDGTPWRAAEVTDCGDGILHIRMKGYGLLELSGRI